MKIALDLDGTIAKYESFLGLEIIGDPLPGATDLVDRLIKEGHTVVIHTTRMNPDVNHKSVRELGDYIINWLKKHNFNHETIVCQDAGKPVADLYIDDRGWHHFTNDSWSNSEIDLVLRHLEASLEIEHKEDQELNSIINRG